MTQLAVMALDYQDVDGWEEDFAGRAIAAPGIGQRKSLGFSKVPGVDRYLDTIGNQHAFIVSQTERHLPADAVDREVRIRSEAKELGDKEVKAMYQQVTSDLLMTAPVREKQVNVVFDSGVGLLFVWSSPSHAEKIVLPAMREALGTAAARFVLPAQEPSAVLSRWLLEGCPDNFQFGNGIVLLDAEEVGGETAFKGMPAASERVIERVAAGDEISSATLIWRGKLAFTINGKFEIKRLGPMETRLKAHQAMNIWPEIMDDLPKFFGELIAAFGGEREVGQQVVAAAKVRKDDKIGPVDESDAAAVSDAKRISEATAGIAGSGDFTLAIVAGDPRFDQFAVKRDLGRVQAKRKIREIHFLKSEGGVARTVMDWARVREIPVRTFDGPEAMCGECPMGVLFFGYSDPCSVVERWAVGQGVPVMKAAK